ncbi:TVP38/TMEM64 family protein [Pseudanabaena sp. UWO311]|uniref:TVP38/TMEM64 family protein n=1 Tax=Pseudanabaena sp. UWO311 TaxID=2487337 RepID=UPI00115AA0E2|nr:TVP38/TMEM64 family protein [Pseudanabaena sp. UWO311]TYQ27210.1 TVP38/TMEM64 family protein [Pseudanabaena sp. UWO311]
MKRSRFNTLRFWLKVIFLIASVLILIAVFQKLNINVTVSNLLQSTLLWVKMLGVMGAIAFIVIYNLATILFVPASILTLGGGAIYGVIWGSIYVFVAATLGAIFAFLIGRYFARGWVSEKLRNNKTFRAIDAAVAIDGFKIVLLTRLSPIFPFNMLNYIFGVTRVDLKDYILGSIGMIPATIMYVYLGSLIGDVALLGIQTTSIASNPQTQIAQWAIKIVGLGATLGVTIQFSRLANKILASKLP